MRFNETVQVNYEMYTVIGTFKKGVDNTIDVSGYGNEINIEKIYDNYDDYLLYDVEREELYEHIDEYTLEDIKNKIISVLIN